MGRLGFGAGRFRARRGRAPGPVVTIGTIAPSASWTGTAASGFATTPTDPARTTAKPVLRMIVPDKQRFTDTLLVGVIAAANNGGSLLADLGIDKVTVHYEGTSVDIAAPTFQTFADANGNAVSYFGWWVQLEHNGTHGEAQLYFEAVAKDATMQHRVVGPYSFLPAATLHDLELEVAPSQPVIAGQRYQTFQAAATYAQSQAKQSPRLTFTEAGVHVLDQLASGYNAKGRLTVEASVPVTLRGGTSYIAGYFYLNVPMRFRGANVTVDMLGYGQFTGYNGLSDVFDGCTVTDSSGRGGLTNKALRSTAWTIASNTGTELGRSWVLEAQVSDLPVALCSVQLARGCRADRCYGDLYTDALAVIGGRTDDLDGSVYVTGWAALAIAYAGAGTGTVEFGGALAPTFTFKVAGSSVGTWIASNVTTSPDHYTNQHLVDYINGGALGAGWSATLIDDRMRASNASLSTGTPGIAIPATDAKTAPLTLWSRADVHGDFRQFGGENRIVMGHTLTNSANQGFFVDTAASDFAAIDNALHNIEGGAAYTYLYATHSHVVFAHNTFASQRVELNGTRDGYCLFANNAALELVWTSAADADQNIRDNHLRQGTDPSGATGTSFGGTLANLFVDAAGGDFTPQGALLANLKAPVVKYDLAGTARGATAPAGAVA